LKYAWYESHYDSTLNYKDHEDKYQVWLMSCAIQTATIYHRIFTILRVSNFDIVNHLKNKIIVIWKIEKVNFNSICYFFYRQKILWCKKLRGNSTMYLGNLQKLRGMKNIIMYFSGILIFNENYFSHFRVSQILPDVPFLRLSLLRKRMCKIA
jgi:hypothetical protein